MELADISAQLTSSLEMPVLHALWGPSTRCRSKEIIFALLVLRHRVAPTMVVPYKQICSLSKMACTRGTPGNMGSDDRQNLRGQWVERYPRSRNGPTAIDWMVEIGVPRLKDTLSGAEPPA